MDPITRQYKIQARNMARNLSSLLTQADVDAFERYGGGALCHRCGLPWYDHPEIEDGIAKGLVVTCDGNLVKL